MENSNQIQENDYLDTINKILVRFKKDVSESSVNSYNPKAINVSLNKINELEKENASLNPFHIKILNNIKSVYAFITKSEEILHSPEYIALKKHKKSLSLNKDIISKKIDYTEDLISILEYNIASVDANIETKLTEKKTVDSIVRELEFESEKIISQLELSSDDSEQSNLCVKLEKLKLDYESAKDNQESYEKIISLYSSSRENTYQDKRSEERILLVLNYSHVALENMLTRVNMYLKKESIPSRIKSVLISKNRSSELNNLENKIIDDETKIVNFYNLAMDKSPSETDININLSSKKRNSPRPKI